MKKFLLLTFLSTFLVLTGSFFLADTVAHAQGNPWDEDYPSWQDEVAADTRIDDTNLANDPDAQASQVGNTTVKPEEVTAACAGNIFAKIICTLGQIPAMIMKAIGNAILWLASIILWVVGIFLNLVINITVIHGSRIIKELSAINFAWTLFRDLTNVAGIFILLYISFQLILGIGSDARRTIGWLILMSLLINFSLFFTKVVIDASNIMAIGFYRKLAPNGALELNPSSWDGGLSGEFMNRLNLNTIYKEPTPGTTENTSAAALAQKFGASPVYFSATIMGSLFIIISAFVFAAIAVLLLTRFVWLVLLMMFSPLAFAAYVLPSTRSYFSKWWHKLISEAFFAPILFLLLWITLELTKSVSEMPSLSAVTNAKSFTDILIGQSTAAIFVVFNYLFIIAFMLYSLVLAKNMGATGASTMIGWGKKASTGAKAAIGRNTLGRGARAMMDNESVKKFASRSSFGQTLYGGLKNVKDSSYGGGKGKNLEAVEKEKVKGRAEFAEYIASKPKTPPKRGEGFAGTPPVIATTHLSQTEQKIHAEGADSKEAVKTLAEQKQKLLEEQKGWRQDSPEYKTHAANIENIDKEIAAENKKINDAKRLEQKAAGLETTQHLNVIDKQKVSALEEQRKKLITEIGSFATDTPDYKKHRETLTAVERDLAKENSNLKNVNEYSSLHDDLYADTTVDSQGNTVGSTGKLRQNAEVRLQKMVEMRKGIDPSNPTFTRLKDQETKLQEELETLRAKEEVQRKRLTILEKAGEERRKIVAPTDTERSEKRMDDLKKKWSNAYTEEDRKISQQALKDYEKKAEKDARDSKKKDTEKKMSTPGSNTVDKEDVEDMQETIKKQAEKMEELEDRIKEKKD